MRKKYKNNRREKCGDDKYVWEKNRFSWTTHQTRRLSVFWYYHIREEKSVLKKKSDDVIIMLTMDMSVAGFSPHCLLLAVK